MSVEIAFLLLVAAFIILSSVLKQLAKKSGEAEKPASGSAPGWKGKLQKMLQEIQREMEAGREETRKTRPEEASSSGRGRWWEELMQPEEAWEAQQTEARQAEAAPEAPYRHSGQEAERQARQDAAFTRRAGQTDWSHSSAGQEPGELGMAPAGQAEEAESRVPRISRRTLRQAVIWSEILGRPVALRGERKSEY